MLPIGNRPLLSYQLDYLERNGITKITVVIEKRFLAKVEKYMNSYFKPSREGTEIEVVALSDEEESGNVLKLLKDRITKDFIVLSGDVLVDVPLDQIIDNHNLNENSVTVLLKELDLASKAKMPGGQKGEPESYDIFGLADWSASSTENHTHRIVFKSNSVESQNMPLFVKASLLKKCHKMRVRTDLADGGVYVFKYWVLRLFEELEKDYDVDNSSIDDLITFMARNQFKKKLAKYIVKPKSEPKLGLSSHSYQAKIQAIMNPSLQTTKDLVKVAAFIDTEPLHYFVKFHNLKYYMLANQDAMRLSTQRPLFSYKGPSADLLSQYKSQIDENKRDKKTIYEGLPAFLK